MKLKEEKYKFDSFIGGWFIPEKVCDKLVRFFEKSKKRHFEGGTYKGNKVEVDKTIKESTDIAINASDTLLEEYNKYLEMCVINYSNKYSTIKNCFGSYTSGAAPYNIQRYLPNQGYKKFHCERHNIINTKRCLVFMTYLNDVQNGGTEFLYQKITTKAKKGLTLIWPSDFTHTHRGQICDKTKYIITGWFDFI